MPQHVLRRFLLAEAHLHHGFAQRLPCDLVRERKQLFHARLEECALAQMAPLRPRYLYFFGHAPSVLDLSNHHFPLPSFPGSGRGVERRCHGFWIADDAFLFTLLIWFLRIDCIENGTGCYTAGFGALRVFFSLLGFLGLFCVDEFRRRRVENLSFSAGFKGIEGIFEKVCQGGSSLVEARTCDERVEVGFGEKGVAYWEAKWSVAWAKL